MYWRVYMLFLHCPLVSFLGCNSISCGALHIYTFFMQFNISFVYSVPSVYFVECKRLSWLLLLVSGWRCINIGSDNNNSIAKLLTRNYNYNCIGKWFDGSLYLRFSFSLRYSGRTNCRNHITKNVPCSCISMYYVHSVSVHVKMYTIYNVVIRKVCCVMPRRRRRRHQLSYILHCNPLCDIKKITTLWHRRPNSKITCIIVHYSKRLLCDWECVSSGGYNFNLILDNSMQHCRR